MVKHQSSNHPDQTSPQPVAYDTNGRPLYHHPPAGSSTDFDTPAKAENYHYVHMRRPISPEKPEVSPEIMAKHEASKKAHPNLNLSEGEYIIRAISRHPIGLMIPASLSLLLILLAGAGLIALPYLGAEYGIDASAYGLLYLVGFMLMLLFALGGYVAVWVYANNRFFLTNESVIQEIQTSLFAKHEQTVSLANIEDASYVQHGIFPYLFNYGSIRLSTEGDETTYRFEYVARPKEQIAILNNAVEAFKNGRPVEDN